MIDKAIKNKAISYKGRYLQLCSNYGLPSFPTQEWRTIRHRLTTKMIERALQGKGTQKGYYAATVSSVAAIDIDDHKDGGWQGDKITQALKNKYLLVLQAAPVKPSFVFRTPHGIHCYWILDASYPTLLINQATKKLFGGIAEIRPTLDCGLRIPALNNRLTVDTLQALSKDADFITYPAPLLFDDGLTPATVKASAAGGGKIGNTANVAKVENSFIQSMIGNSNDALNNLIPVYRSAGLDADGATQRFSFLLKESGYRGELQNKQRLKSRIISFYKRQNADILAATKKPTPHQLSFDDYKIIEAIKKNHPFTYQRTKPVEQFVLSVLDWCNWQDAVYSCYATRAVWGYVYPFWRHNMRGGWYPLPSSVLLGFNKRYNELLEYLIQINFLIPSPHFKYQTAGTWEGEYRAGTCKHYGVCRDVRLLQF